MLIIGAGGFAKEILEICLQRSLLKDLCFYDDITSRTSFELYSFPILNSLGLAQNYFENIDNQFTLGLGNPTVRKEMYYKFPNLGGELVSTISSKVDIGSFDVNINIGANILDGVKIGIASIIYYNAIIAHDCKLGDFVEVSPNVTVLGRVEIGNET